MRRAAQAGRHSQIGAAGHRGRDASPPAIAPARRRAGQAPQGRGERAGNDHRLPLQGPGAARALADAHLGAGRRQPRQQLPAARIPRRPRARADHLRHAVPRLPERRRGRAVAAARRSGAPRVLRRRGARDRSRRPRCGSAPRRSNAGGRLRTAILADVCEALVGAVYLDGGYDAAASWSSGSGASACARRRGRCAIPRPCCRNGRRRAACRRRPTARSSAPARTTIRNSASPSTLPNREPAEGRRPLQARRRAGRRRRHARARRRARGPPRWLRRRARRHALRLHRADRRAQCRQVDADQCAGRQQGRDRHPQGADHAHAGARHRDGGRRPARVHRHAGHLRAAAAARPRHGDDGLGRRGATPTSSRC